MAPVLAWDECRCVEARALLLSDEASFVHPIVVDELGDIVSHGIREENDNTLSFSNVELLDDTDGSTHGATRGATNKHTLLSNEAASVIEGLLIVSLDPLVNVLSAKNSGNEIITDTLNLVRVDSFLVEVIRLSKDRTVGVNTDNLDLRVKLLELSGDTSNLASSTSTNDNIVNFATALVVNFLTSFVVVSKRI